MRHEERGQQRGRSGEASLAKPPGTFPLDPLVFPRPSHRAMQSSAPEGKCVLCPRPVALPGDWPAHLWWPRPLPPLHGCYFDCVWSSRPLWEATGHSCDSSFKTCFSISTPNRISVRMMYRLQVVWLPIAREVCSTSALSQNVQAGCLCCGLWFPLLSISPQDRKTALSVTPLDSHS